LEEKRFVMKKNLVVGSMVMLVSMFASEAVYAAPVAVHSPVHAAFSHSKMVSFSVRNDTKAPFKVKAGANDMTVEPGKTVAVKLAVGDKIVATETTPNYPAGTVIVVTSRDLSDTTVAVN
jgi:hypothetical protein